MEGAMFGVRMSMLRLVGNYYCNSGLEISVGDGHAGYAQNEGYR